jgi:aldose 1-epimerase
LITQATFGHLPSPDDSSVDLCTLRNAHGTEIRAISYGAIIQSILVADANGQLADIVLGCDTLEGYLAGTPHFGAIVGRYANRIARGRFTLDGHTYALATNNGPNHLHGGVRGFDTFNWSAAGFERSDGVGVSFSRLSADGEEGYPGNLEARVTYTLTARNELIIDILATTDRPTPVNLSQHTYFNLHGAGSRSGEMLGHLLQIPAEAFTPVDATLIPTGSILSVVGTPFDFRAPTAIGARIDADDPQIRLGSGYDHNYVLKRTASTALGLAARVVEPISGRTLDVHTTEPGMQLYTGNFLDGTVLGKHGNRYGRRTAFCLETQHFPDSPNHPHFPSTILRPGSEYRSRTVWAFGISTATKMAR